MDKKELKELTVSIIERLRQAIKEGDTKKALALTDEIDRNKHDFDESYRVWIDLMLTHIADKLGEDELYEIHRMNSERALWPRFGWVFDPSLSMDEKVRRTAYAWTHWHMSNIPEIIEDDEKFTFRLKCDSGGSIRMWPEYGKTKEAHLWSWGKKGASLYCVHCPITHEIMAIEKGGRPTFISEPQPDGWCIRYFYKDPDKIPEKYYKRVGMTKNAAKGVTKGAAKNVTKEKTR